MKIYAFLFAVTFSTLLFGKGNGIYQQVLLVKDSLNTDIPRGKTKITANFFYQVQISPYEFEYRKCNQKEPALYLLNGKKASKTNDSGSFSELVDTNLLYIQFQKDLSTDSPFEIIYFENYKLKSQHEIELAIYIPLKISQQMIFVDKPVIYLYNEQEINFTLNLETKGDLSFTYPQLPKNNTWKMKTLKNGNLLSESGKEYPYLFWEAKQNLNSFKQTTANSQEIILGVNLVSYFESELSKLGLNYKEKTDFITYWCPKFNSSENVLVQFYLDENCEVIGKLNINPKPKNIRRIYVTFQKNPLIHENFKTKKLETTAFNREGFTVIEWGGSEIMNDDL